MADRMHKSQSFVSQLEKEISEPSYSDLYFLSQFFRVPPCDLFPTEIPCDCVAPSQKITFMVGDKEVDILVK